MRSITEAEIQTRAEARIPEYKEGQKKYAQDYRVQVHQCSCYRITSEQGRILLKNRKRVRLVPKNQKIN